MKKSLYLFGGLLVLAVAADLTDQGSGLIRVVADSLQFEFGHEVPDSIGQAAYVALHLLALLLGLTLASIGLLKHSAQHSMTSGGRGLHGLAGVAVLVAAGMSLVAIYFVQMEFVLLGLTDDAGDLVERQAALEAVIQTSSETIRNSFMILGAAGGLFSLAAIAGLKTWPPREDAGLEPRIRVALQGITALLAIVGVSLLFLVISHVDQIRVLLEDSEVAPQPTQLSGELASILNLSLISFVLIGLLGLLHVVAASVAAGPMDEAELEALIEAAEAAAEEAGEDDTAGSDLPTGDSARREDA